METERMKITVLVSGDREWKDYHFIYNTLWQLVQEIGPEYSDEIILVHGDCRGADKFAGAAAEELGIEVRSYPAKWQEQKKAAGAIRNRLMLEKEKPDIVLAFHNNLAKSKGTKDMVLIANAAGVEVRLYSSRRGNR